jgi:ubiquitin-conjugating enzyme E2 Q
VGGYPQENTYMITTESMDLPDGVNAILAEIQDSSAGKSIPDLIGTISRKLGKHLAAGSADDPFDLDEDEDMDFNEDDDPDGNASSSEEEAYAMDGDEEFYGQGRSHGTARGVAKAKLSPEIFRQINGRIKSDLRTVKLAGFKIGILCGAKADSISSVVSISVKVDKLGLSEEAIQAWDLDPQQYIVLLIRYNDGYHDFEQIMEAPAKALDIEFRVGVSNKYKPSLVAALAAFTDSINDHSKSSDNSTTNAAQETVEDKAGFSNVFISSSLNEFVNTSFISLLKIRNSVGLSWRGAKSWFNEKQSRIDVKDPELPSSSCNDGYNDDFVATEKNLPDMIARDHLTEEHPIAKPISFPLLAAQFTLRYFARCTEYCLVCHDETKQQFEALKPYVCSKPLCLYQYMSLGFGPSVEHEILTQPYVVDLLISFCYVAAQVSCHP